LSGWSSYSPLILALRRQRQVDLCEFKASQNYITETLSHTHTHTHKYYGHGERDSSQLENGRYLNINY